MDGTVLMEPKLDDHLLAPSVINIMTAANRETLKSDGCNKKTIKKFGQKQDRRYGTYLVYNTTDRPMTLG